MIVANILTSSPKPYNEQHLTAKSIIVGIVFWSDLEFKV